MLVVLDADDDPVWVDAHPSGALADGVVVDFTRATAYPACVGEAESRACRYALDTDGFENVTLLDEVSAARATLVSATA